MILKSSRSTSLRVAPLPSTTETNSGTVRTSTVSTCTSPPGVQKSAASSPDFAFAVTCTNCCWKCSGGMVKR